MCHTQHTHRVTRKHGDTGRRKDTRAEWTQTQIHIDTHAHAHADAQTRTRIHTHTHAHAHAGVSCFVRWSYVFFKFCKFIKISYTL